MIEQDTSMGTVRSGLWRLFFVLSALLLVVGGRGTRAARWRKCSLIRTGFGPTP
jgi:hypothetical protein